MGPIREGGTRFWRGDDRAEPIPQALLETVQTLLKLHDKSYSGVVGYFLAGGYLGGNVFLHVGVQKCCQDV